ncbi:hypothetical protein BDV96DRAFT_607678 [Lophiotrema nucula]|uniref:Uncharacterized protein n=1 Tax=Lophiotrema nucula TaxID=690887 RepID=A0A6A5YJ50_9PLEO|nr:hypothetical protein BDV96DRAFT_607678 [Lophiotrema nucula]
MHKVGSNGFGVPQTNSTGTPQPRTRPDVQTISPPAQPKQQAQQPQLPAQHPQTSVLPYAQQSHQHSACPQNLYGTAQPTAHQSSGYTTQQYQTFKRYSMVQMAGQFRSRPHFQPFSVRFLNSLLLALQSIQQCLQSIQQCLQTQMMSSASIRSNFGRMLKDGGEKQNRTPSVLVLD